MSGSATLQNNLVDDLVPVIDELRGDLYQSMGTRQHEVHLVRRRWTGPERNEGTVAVTLDHVISPPPLFKDGVAFKMTSAGRDFEGDGILSEVSLTYTESDLLGGAIAKNEEFFYRIVDLRGQGLAPQYFVPKDKAFVDREKSIGWIITLHRAEVDE